MIFLLDMFMAFLDFDMFFQRTRDCKQGSSLKSAAEQCTFWIPKILFNFKKTQGVPLLNLFGSVVQSSS